MSSDSEWERQGKRDSAEAIALVRAEWPTAVSKRELTAWLAEWVDLEMQAADRACERDR